MSSAQKLYDMGVISLEECCDRLMLIRSMPKEEEAKAKAIKELLQVKRIPTGRLIQTPEQFMVKARMFRSLIGADIPLENICAQKDRMLKGGDKRRFRMVLCLSRQKLYWPGSHFKEDVVKEWGCFEAVIRQVNEEYKKKAPHCSGEPESNNQQNKVNRK